MSRPSLATRSSCKCTPQVVELVAHVEALVGDALAHGASLLTGGRRHALGGTFFEPTGLVGATPEMRFAQTEIFGPLAPLFRFQTEAEGLVLANTTEHGLAAYFYARDSARIWRVADSLACGMIGINTGLISSESGPFGGVKQSGFGREGSACGVDEYRELKSLTLAGL